MLHAKWSTFICGNISYEMHITLSICDCILYSKKIEGFNGISE